MGVYQGRLFVQGLLFLLVAWSAIPLGSNREIFWAINGLLGTTILVTWAVVFGRTEVTALRNPVLFWQVVGFSFVIAWMVIQAVMAAPAALRHPVWGVLSASNLGSGGTISASPSDALNAASQSVAVLATFLVSAQMATNVQKLGVLCSCTVLISAIFVAAYGFSIEVTGHDRIFWFAQRSYSENLTGTFVNKNTAATFIALGLVVAVALFMASRRTWYHPPALALLAVASFVSVALIKTGSRAGMVSAVIGILAMVLVAKSGGRRLPSSVFAMILMAISVPAVLLGGGVLVTFANPDLIENTRFSLFSAALDLVGERPVLGHGAGSFQAVLPLYQSAAIEADKVWLRAHNTYLQAASDLGLPVFLIGLACVFSALAYLVADLNRSSDSSPVTLAGFGAIVITGIHSLADFSVQIQAVALAAAALIGAGVGDAFRRQEAGAFVLDRAPSGLP